MYNITHDLDLKQRFYGSSAIFFFYEVLVALRCKPVAEISTVNIGNLTQLFKGQISKVLVGNKLFGHYDDGVYQGPVEEIHYKNGKIIF